jgi:hypothetical protein
MNLNLRQLVATSALCSSLGWGAFVGAVSIDPLESGASPADAAYAVRAEDLELRVNSMLQGVSSEAWSALTMEERWAKTQSVGDLLCEVQSTPESPLLEPLFELARRLEQLGHSRDVKCRDSEMCFEAIVQRPGGREFARETFASQAQSSVMRQSAIVALSDWPSKELTDLVDLVASETLDMSDMKSRNLHGACFTYYSVRNLQAEYEVATSVEARIGLLLERVFRETAVFPELPVRPVLQECLAGWSAPFRWAVRLLGEHEATVVGRTLAERDPPGHSNQDPMPEAMWRDLRHQQQRQIARYLGTPIRSAWEEAAGPVPEYDGK